MTAVENIAILANAVSETEEEKCGVLIFFDIPGLSTMQAIVY